MHTSRSVTCLLPPLLAVTAAWVQDAKEAAASPRAHLVSLTLEGQAAFTQVISYEWRGQSVEQVKKFSGTTRYSFAVERAD